MSGGDEQIGLFSAAPIASGSGGPGEPERRRPTARVSSVDRPAWSYYSGPHAACTEHVRFRHEGLSSPDGELPPGRYVRKHKGHTAIMCTGCAQHWRTADGYTTPLPSRPNRK
jgi:hypothetical protein